jgi:hypothetical protein
MDASISDEFARLLNAIPPALYERVSINIGVKVDTDTAISMRGLATTPADVEAAGGEQTKWYDGMTGLVKEQEEEGADGDN